MSEDGERERKRTGTTTMTSNIRGERESKENHCRPCRYGIHALRLRAVAVAVAVAVLSSEFYHPASLSDMKREVIT